jgi:hypothetical protein
MNRLPPVQHPLAALFQRAAQSLTTSLNQDASIAHCFLGNNHLLAGRGLLSDRQVGRTSRLRAGGAKGN